MDVLVCVTAGAEGSAGQHLGVMGLSSAVVCPGLVTSL